MADPGPLLRSIGETLDGLGLAMCVFDDADAAVHWNRSFVKIFPEHEGRITVGEPYRANLRRFYEARLGEAELPSIERYIDEGIARHRAQSRPFAFEHRGQRVWVSSLPLPGVGRIRIWRAESSQAASVALPGAHAPAQAEAPPFDGAGLFDRVPDGVMICAPDQSVLWVNEPFVLLYGLPDRASALGMSFEQVYRTAWAGVAASERAPFDEGLAVLAENLRFAGAPFELPLPGERWSRVIGQRSATGIDFYAHVDITDFKRQQRRLQEAERQARSSQALLEAKSTLLEATLELMEQGVMMVNADRIVEVCNRRAIELLGLPEDLMASRPSFDAVVAHQMAHGELTQISGDLERFVRSGRDLALPRRYDRQRPDGRVIEVQNVPIEGGGVLRTYTDITDRKKSEERIRHVARHDRLTSLVNREVFVEQLELALADAKRAGDAFAVHFIDLDEFKPVNDRYGHAVGDQLLVLIAHRMRHIARDDDVVARMGGDEFAILQRGAQTRESALCLAQRVLESLGQWAEVETNHIRIGASVGIALWPSGGADAQAVLRNADKAMYAAKAAGRNCVRVFDDAAGTQPLGAVS